MDGACLAPPVVQDTWPAVGFIGVFTHTLSHIFYLQDNQCDYGETEDYYIEGTDPEGPRIKIEARYEWFFLNCWIIKRVIEPGWYGRIS